MWPNPKETANWVTFIEEVLNGKLQFFEECGMLVRLKSASN